MEINKQAFEIYDSYVEQGSDNEVNISGKQRKAVKSLIEDARLNDTIIKLNIFDDCQMEVSERALWKSTNEPLTLCSAQVYKLLNQDTFERFKNNDKLLDEMLGKLFDEADVDSDGSITAEEYKKWGSQNPELTNFLKDLHKSTFAGVAKAAGLERRKTLAQTQVADLKLNSSGHRKSKAKSTNMQIQQELEEFATIADPNKSGRWAPIRLPPGTDLTD